MNLISLHIAPPSGHLLHKKANISFPPIVKKGCVLQIYIGKGLYHARDSKIIDARNKQNDFLVYADFLGSPEDRKYGNFPTFAALLFCTYFLFNLQKIVSKMLLVIVTEKRRSPKKNLLFGEDVICCTKNGNIYYEIVGFKRAQSFQFYWNKLNPFDNWKVRMYS